MRKAPDQFETERLLSQALERGDQTALASLMEVSASEINQQFTPQNPKQSVYYRFKRQLWALAAINPNAARLIYADLQSSMEDWLGETKSGDIGKGIASVLKEAAELGAAQCEGLPTHVVKKEALDVRAKVDEVVAACERRAELKAV